MLKKNPEALVKLWQAAASLDRSESDRPTRELATALEPVLRKGVMSCNTISEIFEAQDYSNCRSVEYPLDFVTPGSENDYTAYVVPDCGLIPHRHVEGDYVMVPTYTIANSIEWCLKYQRCANWNVMERAMEVMKGGFTKKINDDGWHVILAAGLDRNIVVYDDAASAGQFTKRLVSLMKLVMRRNGGGNSTCLKRGALTDLYVSPEAMEDIRNWNIDQVDEITRREIFIGADSNNALTRIFGVNLHTLDELGVDMEYQLYYENDLSGTMPNDKLELVVGLDLANRDSFMMPVVQELQVYEDDCLKRHLKRGFYGTMEIGMACCNSQRVLLGAL